MSGIVVGCGRVRPEEEEEQATGRNEGAESVSPTPSELLCSMVFCCLILPWTKDPRKQSQSGLYCVLCVTILPVGGTGRNSTKGPSRLLTIRGKLLPSGKSVYFHPKSAKACLTGQTQRSLAFWFGAPLLKDSRMKNKEMFHLTLPGLDQAQFWTGQFWMGGLWLHGRCSKKATEMVTIWKTRNIRKVRNG